MKEYVFKVRFSPNPNITFTATCSFFANDIRSAISLLEDSAPSAEILSIVVLEDN